MVHISLRSFEGGKRIIGAFLASLGLLLVVSVQSAHADSLAVDFENPPYSLGVINAQDGWSSLGAAGSGCAVYDHAVDSSMGVAGFGVQSLRLSNAVTSGCFGDQTFTKSLGDEAGEADAVNNGSSGGTRQPHFESEFSFSSAQLAQQPGLFVSVSPDRGDGARMSYLGFSDEPGGIDVIFYDVQGENAGFQAANFVPTTVATNLSRAVPHTAKFEIDFVDGPSNDVVKIYIDGVLVHTGTTWENYYRFDTESQGNPHDPALENKSRTVDSLIFRTGGPAAPATAGGGFLFDNITLESSTPVPPPPPSGGPLNSSIVKIEVENAGSIDNRTSANSSTGGNTAEGSSGGRGGRGGDVEASGSGSIGNNGNATAGNGGNGGGGAEGGTIYSGSATSNAGTSNKANTTRVRVSAGEMNSSKLIIKADNDSCCNNITNTTRARARTGGNDVAGSSGGNGGAGGDVEASGSGSIGNNGNAIAGNGGEGGAGGVGGFVQSGSASTTATTKNILNRTRIRVN